MSRRLAEDNKLVLFITHRLHESREVADRVTIWRRGKDVMTGQTKDYTDDEIVEAMLGRKPQMLLSSGEGKTAGKHCVIYQKPAGWASFS